MAEPLVSIAVTGLGIISAIGNNRTEVAESLKNNVSGIGKMHYLGSLHNNLPVGEVKLSNGELKEALGIDDKTEISRTALLAGVAIREALGSLDTSCMHGKKVVLVSGTTVAGMDITETHFAAMRDSGIGDESLQSHSCGRSSDIAASLSGIFSEVITFSTACSSAANAIMLGARMLENHEADIVIAGGAEALSLFHLNGFNSLMILDEERCRPFDVSRRGLNLGEGAAYIMMKRGDELSGEKVYGWLSGYANACDAYHQTATSPDGIGATLAMRQALANAGLSSDEIDYINAHGTGTPDNDKSESAAIRNVFGDDYPPVSSTKSLTGHTTSASGSIEAVICLIAIQLGLIPANHGFSIPFEAGIVPVTSPTQANLRNVMCNSFGFGGNDTVLIFSADRKACRFGVPSDANVAEVVADVSITDESQLAEIKQYVKPIETRRMGKLMKGCILSAMKALEKAAIEVPDAIVTATDFGCIENSELFLLQMIDRNEQTLQPTWFIQSTHNTPGSQIAIRTQCHGYNATYSQGVKSMELAMRDARDLIRRGVARTVLVGSYDESTPLLRLLLGCGDSLPAINCRTVILQSAKS